MASKLFAYFQLTRPANVVTAVADIWAGFALAGAWDTLMVNWIYGDQTFWWNLLWLSLSTIGLYGGGVAFNDIADAELDAIERPERPIPSGRASKKGAMLMASLLLLAGIACAFQVNQLAGLLSIGVAGCALLYDYWGKHQHYFGPINMGLCRAGNLLLGTTVVPSLIQTQGYLGALPLVYVAAITLISRGEVHGKNRSALFLGAGMYASIFMALFLLAYQKSPGYLQILPFLVFLGYRLFPPLVQAIRTQEPRYIGKSVKAAVLSLILVNATLATAYSGWPIGLLILLLLPLSLGLAKKFAVT